MDNGKTIEIHVHEYKHLIEDRARLRILNEYIKNTQYPDKDFALAIIGIDDKKADDEK